VLNKRYTSDVRVHFTLEQAIKPQNGNRVRYRFTLFLIFGARWGRWLTQYPARFTPGKRSISIPQEAGCFPVPVWLCAEHIRTTGLDPRTAQPIAGRYTSWVVPVHWMNDTGLQFLDLSKFCESSSLTERQQKSRSLREYRILSANIVAFMYVIAIPKTWKVYISFYTFLVWI
jgi:hypothetical protein